MLAQRGANLRALSEQELRCFRTNGFVVVRQQVPETFLAGVQRHLEERVDERIARWAAASRLGGHDAASFAHLDFTSRYLEAWIAAGRPTRTPPAYEGLFGIDDLAGLSGRRGLARLARLAADALDADDAVALASSFARARFPEDDASTLPWHQDAPCIDHLTTADFVTAWIPLVDVPVHNPCLELAPMREPAPLEPRWSDRHRYFFMGEPDVDRLTDRRAVSLRRGDLLLFGRYLPHRSLPNLDTTIRWSVDLRFSGGRGRRSASELVDEHGRVG
jgi:hypothetical protein